MLETEPAVDMQVDTSPVASVSSVVHDHTYHISESPRKLKVKLNYSSERIRMLILVKIESLSAKVSSIACQSYFNEYSHQ